jgi:hypothetical protein
MAGTASQPLWYVYGIVPAHSPEGTPPAGLDDTAVTLERGDGIDVAALVSVLSGPEYTPESLEARSGDVDWVSPRAVAHDRVLTWASDRCAVVPLPMWALFSGRDAVHTMLRDRGPLFAKTFARVGDAREYALRVYRVDAELLESIGELSPKLGELATSAAAASPGQRYLLERKLEAEKKTEMRTVTQQIVDGIVETLTPHASQVVRSPIPRVADAGDTRGTMVLNAAFLVAPSRMESFQQTLTKLVTERTAQGFRFDFTGPWPPYHFVNEPADG